MFALPQGFAVDGLCTSLRAPLPVTPRAGAIKACAETWRVRERRKAKAKKNLENMLSNEMSE